MSSDCHKRIRRMVDVLEGVQQIKDYVIIHCKGHEYDRRLKALLIRMKENGITFRRDKCEWGQPETYWFGMIYN